MKRHLIRRYAACLTLAGAAVLLGGAGVAGATGTARVQLSDGKVTEYPDVRFTIANHALTLTSPDGKGVLRISIVNCVPVGGLHRCEPGGADYRENGEIRAFDIVGGTMYFNGTDEKQPLSHSSTQVAPYSVLLTLKTVRGTYITAAAAIDGLKK